MTKYLILNGKRMSKSQMCNILNDLNECYFEPIDYDYKLMVDVFVRWMRSLNTVALHRSLVKIYNLSSVELLKEFNSDVIRYYR